MNRLVRLTALVATLIPGVAAASPACPPPSAAEALPGARAVRFDQAMVTTARFPGAWQEGRFGKADLSYRLFVDGTGSVAEDLRLRGWRVDFDCSAPKGACAVTPQNDPPKAAMDVAKAIAACLRARPPAPAKAKPAPSASGKPVFGPERADARRPGLDALGRPRPAETKAVRAATAVTGAVRPAAKDLARDLAKGLVRGLAGGPARPAPVGRVSAASPDRTGAGKGSAGRRPIGAAAAAVSAGAVVRTAKVPAPTPRNGPVAADGSVIRAPRGTVPAATARKPAVPVLLRTGQAGPSRPAPALCAPARPQPGGRRVSTKPTGRGGGVADAGRPADRRVEGATRSCAPARQETSPARPAAEPAAGGARWMADRTGQGRSGCWIDRLPEEHPVARIQRVLLLAGFDPGPVDGHLGRRTRTALDTALGVGTGTLDGRRITRRLADRFCATQG